MQKFDLKAFFMELLPPSIAKRVDASYSRPEKGNMVASFIRLIVFILTVQYFVVRPYMVPTGSMKNTIMENDFLLVNRFVYGLRTPDNISIPFTDKYFVRNVEPIRFTPEFREVKSNDVVVFRADHEEPPVEYVKRCVAAAGDSISMVDGKIYINGELFRNSDNSILPSSYLLELDSNEVSATRFRLASGMLQGSTFNQGLIRAVDFPTQKSATEIFRDLVNTSLTFTATLKKDLLDDVELRRFLLNRIEEAIAYRASGRAHVGEESYETALLDATKMYQSGRYFAGIQNLYNFGTIYIPKEGDVLRFDEHHFDVISNVVFYDGHTLDVKDGIYYINGEAASEYTVEQDYYFFIGDNRTGSLDSRQWGMIPRKYISGAPMFIYFSVHQDAWRNQPLWSAIFRTFKYINGDRIGKMIL